MANIKLYNSQLFLLLLTLILLPAYLTQGFRTQVLLPNHQQHNPSQAESHSPNLFLQKEREMGSKIKGEMSRNSRRLMIGSTAPTCTYNECRGCKYKCTAEQVPVEGNDPINSAYHYKCVCHR